MRMFAFALAVVGYWLLFACAFAKPAHAESLFAYGIELPPASYLNKTPDVPVFIHHVADPNEYCQALFPAAGWRYDACTVLLSDRCDVYEPMIDPTDEKQVGTVGAIEIHEVQAHLRRPRSRRQYGTRLADKRREEGGRMTTPTWPDTLAVFALAKPIIKKWEALKLLPYLCPTGHWSIGYGSTQYPNGQRVKRTDPKIDKPWAEVMLTHHMTEDEKMIQACITRVPTQHQAAALQCIAYNVGVGLHDGATPDLANSQLIAAFNAGDIQGAADHFLDWDKGHVMGKVVVIDGLKNRRMDERLLFLVPDKAA